MMILPSMSKASDFGRWKVLRPMILSNRAVLGENPSTLSLDALERRELPR